ncbi:MAG: hypothetical protein GX464_03700 [Holophagae bacterium]|nr:hypothetical protein [Holophagae bacterium]
MRRSLLVASGLAATACGSAPSARPTTGSPAVELVGSATIPTGTEFAGTEVGGLSGLAYDPGTGCFLAVSDDRSQRAPARVYTLALDLARGRLGADGVHVVGVTVLRDAAGATFAPRSVDFEGLARLGDGTLFLSSEGDVYLGTPPFVGRFSAEGVELGRLALPEVVIPHPERGWGVRDNLGFEALTAAPDGRSLFLATENALAQDGPKADLTTGTYCRVLRFSLPDGGPTGQWLYPVAPVPAPPDSPRGFRTNGLSDLLALDDGRFLALERASVDGRGYSVRLYLTSLAGATDVSAVPALTGQDVPVVRPMVKRLLLDLGTLGLRLQNLESMAFGPDLPDGRRALVVVGDNNFGARGDTTQILAFAVRIETLDRLPPRQATIPGIQGAGHASPYFGEEVVGVAGVVTAVVEPGAEPGFWMQAPVDDGNERTSEGIFVTAGGVRSLPAVGDEVRVEGIVEEALRGRDLPLTRLVATRFEVVGRGRVLPEPVIIGPDGRQPPQEVIENDGFTVFDPVEDGADFFESLEGMRVAVGDPHVVGPTSARGEWVVTAGPPPTERRTARGGIAIAPDRFNPQRLIVSARLVSAAPQVAVGDRFAGPLVGVIDYAFGTYRLVLTDPPPEVRTGDRQPETTALVGSSDRLSIASFNVENLARTSPEEKFSRVAAIVATHLRGPDIVALQEIQDDSGPADDGVTTARGTLARLVERIVRAGGPHYEARQIDPENNQDGGAPGANIRVALLVNPARVRFVDRGVGGSTDPVRVMEGPQGLALAPSPGRVDPDNAVWRPDRARGVERSRKPLAGELLFGDRRVFVVNVHLKSKGGDAPLFGRVQPPSLPSQVQRDAQARVVRDFVAGILARDPAAAVVVLGDCNEFPFAPPIETLISAPLVDLAKRLDPADRYTFVFQGNSQVLDHILVSPAIAGDAKIDAVHINADFPDRSRAADHDPLIATLRLR